MLKQVFILICIFSNFAYANDFIFKNSFENTGTVSGNLIGLAQSKEITLQLQVQNKSVEDLVLSSNQTFSFATSLEIDTTFEVIILIQPTIRNCTINNGDGIMLIGGYDLIEVDCNEQNALWDQFNWDDSNWN